jgi:hypothetical protein
MKRRTVLKSIPLAAFIPSSTWAAMHAGENFRDAEKVSAAAPTTTVYELRIYHAAAGKLPELLARFREHTLKLFERHGMKTLAFWTPTDEPQKNEMLMYILEHPSREAATANWKSFQDDPEWKAVKAKSEDNGGLVDKVDSTYMALTEFSPRLKYQRW